MRRRDNHEPKPRVPARIQDTETDVDALKWFVARTRSRGAILVYFDEDDIEALYYGRTPAAVRQCKDLYRGFLGKEPQ